MNVLVAHGDPERRGRLARGLEQAGHDVTAVASGADALARCCAGSEDVAVIDRALCALPTGDLVAALKGDPEAFATAVVLIERVGPDADGAREALGAGVQDFLVE